MHRPSSTRTRPLLGALVVIAVTLAACSGSSQAPYKAPAAPSAAAPSGPAASGAPAEGTAVTIQNFAFGPASLSVAVGGSVTWTNKDSVSHTVTADDGSFGSQKVAPGATFSQTFSKAGTFAYHCTIHPSMTATVVVH